MRMKKLVAAAGLLALAQVADAKTIGIWAEGRNYVSDGLTNTLAEAGWDIVWFSRKDKSFENVEKLNKTDVIFAGGGWNAYFFPTPKSRLNLVRYVAAGKGIFLAGFRSGYTRTANRPMFPEIGEVYNRVSCSWIWPEGKSDLAKAFNGKPVVGSGNDHLCIRRGKWGEAFCHSSEDIVGAFGDYYCGRVIVYGGHFGYKMVDETRADAERLFLASLKYLTGQRKPSPEEQEKAVAAAATTFIKRELLWTWTNDDRGPDRRPGIVAEWRDKTTAEPEALAYKLDYYATLLAGPDAGKCANMSKLLKGAVAGARRQADAITGELREKIEKMRIDDLLFAYVSGNAPIDVEAIRRRIQPQVKEPQLEAAKKLLAEVQPKVKAAKKAALEKEIAEDLKGVPALVEKLGSKCPKERLEAALEVGRISPDDESAVQALCAALSDADEKVRTQAATSLGWMQAKNAVDALVRNLAAKSVFDRRRAIQALGFIGEKKAVPAVMKTLSDPDSLCRMYAVVALGHLKATEAVERLVAIAEDEKAGKELKCAAILALGDIGDKRAQGVLEKIHADSKPYMSRDRKGVPQNSNYLSNKNPCGVNLASEWALANLAKGGRAAPGVKQPEEYRSRDMFYAVTKKCNFFAGRTGIRGSGGIFGGVRQKLLWAHLKGAGFTGVHNSWGAPSGWMPGEFKEVVREADDLGLVWIDVMPGSVRCDCPMSEILFEEFSDIPAYHGVWAEETWPKMGGNVEEFKAFLVERYGNDWAKTLKLRDDELKVISSEKSADWNPDWIGFSCAGPNKKLEAGFEPPWDGTLRTLVIEFGGKILEDTWRESQEYLHARRKGFAQTYVISTADPTKVIGGIRAAERLDSLGHESYESFGRGSAYFMERYRNGGAPRSAMSEQYHWYCPSNAHALRGFWQNAIHSKCYYDFSLHQMFAYPSWYDMWSWERGRWDAAKEVFTRVAKTPDLYEISPSAANAAVVFSERSSSAVKEQVYFQCPVPTRNDHNVMAAWAALNELQIPSDVIWAETLDKTRLSKYKFLYLPTAKYLDDGEIEAIREWVREGGVLVAEGTTSLFGGHSLKNRGNYALADVFGCDWKETLFRTGDDSDTFAGRHGVSSAFKVVPGLDSPLHIDDSIHRAVKPEKSVVVAKVAADAGEWLPGLKKGAEIEIDGALGFDVVKPTTAKVLAEWKGRPAILVNEFGRGRSFFVAANYFAHAHVASRWEMLPGKFDFWNNVLESIGAMAKSGYAAVQATLPVEVSGVSKEVEVSVADFGSKYVVHMLDCDVFSEGVAGAKLFIPGERKIRRVYYPGEKEPLKLDGRTAHLRDFKVYDMFVVEFEQ